MKYWLGELRGSIGRDGSDGLWEEYRAGKLHTDEYYMKMKGTHVLVEMGYFV